MKAITNPDYPQLKPLTKERYLQILKTRKTKKKWQPTRHQQDAADTAELFGDVKSIGIYLNIFKKYKNKRPELLRCKDWVMRKGKNGKGNLFVAVYKKFLRPYGEAELEAELAKKEKQISKKRKPTKKELLAEMFKKKKGPSA